MKGSVHAVYVMKSAQKFLITLTWCKRCPITWQNVSGI